MPVFPNVARKNNDLANVPAAGGSVSAGRGLQSQGRARFGEFCRTTSSASSALYRHVLKQVWRYKSLGVLLLPQVTCGSVIKLEHDRTNHYLHSHEVAYGTGRGSGQQSVTGYPERESGSSMWIVRSAEVRRAPCRGGPELHCIHVCVLMITLPTHPCRGTVCKARK